MQYLSTAQPPIWLMLKVLEDCEVRTVQVDHACQFPENFDIGLAEAVFTASPTELAVPTGVLGWLPVVVEGVNTVLQGWRGHTPAKIVR